MGFLFCELPVGYDPTTCRFTRRLLCQLSYGSITGILHACPVAGFPKNQPDKGGKTGRF